MQTETDKETDGRTDRQTDRRTNGKTDRRRTDTDRHGQPETDLDNHGQIPTDRRMPKISVDSDFVDATAELR